jgi:hypothetical protein
MDMSNRTVAATTTLAMLVILFAAPVVRADEDDKLQDRFSSQEVVVDANIDRARLVAAARRLQPTITVETRVGPNTSILTRIPATTTIAQR